MGTVRCLFGESDFGTGSSKMVGQPLWICTGSTRPGLLATRTRGWWRGLWRPTGGAPLHRFPRIPHFPWLPCKEVTCDLKLSKKCAKYVPRLLTPVNVRKRRDCCEFFLRLVRQFPKVLANTVTMDESWVYQYDPETKQQSKQWLPHNSPRPIKALWTRATGKVFFCLFF